MLQEAVVTDAKKSLELIKIYHASNPAELYEAYQEAIYPPKPTSFLEGVSQLAMALADQKNAEELKMKLFLYRLEQARGN
jgi:hypothetical protein